MTRSTYPPRHILVPLDFSRPSRFALAYAARIAAATGASIDVLHAGTPIPQVPSYVGIPETTLGVAAGMTDLLRQRELSGRAQLLQEILPYQDDHEIGLYWWDGDPAAAIEKFARERNASLIVMGTHGRSGMGRALLGSVAERTARTVDRPVLLVREPAGAKPEALPPFPPRRVLAPTDLSEPALEGIDYAAALAAATGATLRLLHVLPTLTGMPLTWPEASATVTYKAAHDARRASAIALLNREADRFEGVDVATGVTDGGEADGIVQTAQDDGTDLIVISSHGRGGLGRLLLGSVAERTARLAPCPVLIVKRAR